MLITSTNNPRVKDAAKLRDRRQRDKQRRILIDGSREISLALQGGVRIGELFWCAKFCDSELASTVVQAAEAQGAELLEVTPEVFAKIAYGERAEGVIAVADTPARSLADLKLPEHAIVGVLEGVEKPGNVGAVLRTADGAGLDALIIADGRTDLYNPNAIRASLGTIFTVPVVTATSAETLHWLRDQDWEILAARVDGTADYRQAPYHRGAAIVLGSEALGLSSQWTGPDITPIALPMRGKADSLNVSATAAILFYEATYQRETKH